MKDPKHLFLNANLPVVAIVGRPNVGKSTLFNALTNSRDALVVNLPGVTRDRHYGVAEYHARRFLCVDTGGLLEKGEMGERVGRQAEQAMQEADLLVFVVDAQSGLIPGDAEIIKQLRKLAKPVVLVVNKVDGIHEHAACTEFYSSGFATVLPVVATQKRGLHALLAKLVAQLPAAEPLPELATEQEWVPQVAVIGRPNVGKSTLVNRLLGEERMLVCDAPGTTRDSIFIPFHHHDKAYVLIDTAGVRRRARINEALEKFSVVRSLQAIEQANVVIYVIDAQEGITDQDLRLLGMTVQAGRSLVISINKWDRLPEEQRQKVEEQILTELRFVDYAVIHKISALQGTGVGDLYRFIDAAYAAARKELATHELTVILQGAVQQNAPPLVRGRRIKLRYAHAGGKNPPLIIIHGNQVDDLPDSYRRYLESQFRQKLNLVGTPVRIQCKAGSNPYAGRVNKLTPKQIKKRTRLQHHTKD